MARPKGIFSSGTPYKYRGALIYPRKGRWVVDGATFNSLGSAKKWVDRNLTPQDNSNDR